MRKRSISLLFIPLLLTSCQSSLVLSYVPFTSYVDNMNTSGEIKGDNYIRDSFHDNVILPYSSGGSNTISSLKQVSASRDGRYTFNNIGDLKLLVVPVRFKGSPDEFTKEKITLLKNTFFGDSKMTSYESVASFYNKSSYGKVKITGEVTDFFTYDDHTAEELAKLDGDSESKSRRVAAKVADWLHTQNKIDLSKYDIDGDNRIDGVYLVYDYPFLDKGKNSTSLFWAYFDSVKQGHKIDDVAHNTESPYVSSYSWSSFEFTGKQALKDFRVDTNTFIHEVGHLFGLDDYYNSNAKYKLENGSIDTPNSGIFQPTGFMDMMDYNLGDHCSFSKYLLDWTSPYLVTDEGEITLKSFTTSGEFIIVPPLNKDGTYNWNKSPFDEYLLIEYFTPTGLNDSFNFDTYTYRDGKGNEAMFEYPTRHGVRVYHVDARLAYYLNRSSASPKCWIDSNNLEKWYKETPSSGKYIGFLNSNATLGTVDSTTSVLVNLLEANRESQFYKGVAASNATLFGLNSTFGVSKYRDFVFNKPSKEGYCYNLPYTFEITKLNSEEVTIKFTKYKID